MRAFKLVRELSSGELSPLFINVKLRLPLNEWMEAEEHPTKGFAVRKGWHCTAQPHAPHLSIKGRVWIEVEIDDFAELQRPECQGGLWYLAQQMKVTKILDIT